MIVKINGQETIQAKRIEVVEPVSDAAAWGVVLIGILAAIGWWQLW